MSIQRREADRIAKFGHIRPVVSQEFAGQRFIAVGSRLLHDTGWKTFPDFLFAYIGSLLQKDWFTTELDKPIETRHPLMLWYHLLQQLGALRNHEPGQVQKIESPPAQISALLSFAYDLYTLEHHSVLSETLIARLKRPDHFQGARYEAFVAAACIRAGFEVVLEDESDFSSSHCEFTITYQATGAKYCVEAKSRTRTGFLGQAGSRKPLAEIQADLKGLFIPALRKAAAHERVVFIDVNVPPSEASLFESEWFNKIGSQLLRFEKNGPGDPLPSALVFFTNFPYHFVEQFDPLHSQVVVLTGFKMPEFHGATSDNEIIRLKHAPIIELYNSLLRHTAVPQDF